MFCTACPNLNAKLIHRHFTTTPFIYKKNEKFVPVLVNPALQFNYNKISRLVLSELSGIQRINKSVYAFTCTFAKIQKRKKSTNNLLS